MTTEVNLSQPQATSLRAQLFYSKYSLPSPDSQEYARSSNAMQKLKKSGSFDSLGTAEGSRSPSPNKPRFLVTKKAPLSEPVHSQSPSPSHRLLDTSIPTRSKRPPLPGRVYSQSPLPAQLYSQSPLPTHRLLDTPPSTPTKMACKNLTHRLLETSSRTFSSTKKGAFAGRVCGDSSLSGVRGVKDKLFPTGSPTKT